MVERAKELMEASTKVMDATATSGGNAKKDTTIAKIAKPGDIAQQIIDVMNEKKSKQ